MEITYLAIGAFSYGYGKTIKEAVKNAKINDTRKGRLNQSHFVIYESEDPDIGIDQMGCVHWSTKFKVIKRHGSIVEQLS